MFSWLLIASSPSKVVTLERLFADWMAANPKWFWGLIAGIATLAAGYGAAIWEYRNNRKRLEKLEQKVVEVIEPTISYHEDSWQDLDAAVVHGKVAKYRTHTEDALTRAHRKAAKTSGGSP